MTVIFAEQEDEADDTIELLIGQDFSPKKLTVVSSDHRIHALACCRRPAADSDVWALQTLTPTNPGSKIT